MKRLAYTLSVMLGLLITAVLTSIESRPRTKRERQRDASDIVVEHRRAIIGTLIFVAWMFASWLLLR